MEKTAKNIVNKLQENGFIAVFAGGCVRDRLLNKQPKDFDIATTATPDEVESIFERTIPVGKSFGVVRVLDEFEFEVATFRKDQGSDGRRPVSVSFTSMEEDANRRDFTINGMFFDPISETLFDFVGGQQDLQNKLIKFIGNPHDRIADDKLRMIRAIRFATNFKFKIDSESFRAIRLNAHSISAVSRERIRDEFSKSKDFGGFISGLVESGLMTFIIPEVLPMIGSTQNPEHHPEGDVFVHTIRVLNFLNTDDLCLNMAGLLHDIGKPQTREDNGKITNHGHQQVSVELAKIILNRLKFSNDEIEKVVFLIENHMLLHSMDMKKSKLRRIKASPFFADLLRLIKADCQSAMDDLEDFNKLTELFNTLPDELPKCLVNGRDLMALGFKEGKELGKVIKKIFNLQLEGVLVTKEDQLTFAKGKL
jgi:poly(A) polymerase